MDPCLFVRPPESLSADDPSPRPVPPPRDLQEPLPCTAAMSSSTPLNPQARTPPSTLPPYSASSSLPPRPGAAPSTLPGPRRSPCTPTLQPKSTHTRTISRHFRPREASWRSRRCRLRTRRTSERHCGSTSSLAARLARRQCHLNPTTSISTYARTVRGTVDAVTRAGQSHALSALN